MSTSSPSTRRTAKHVLGLEALARWNHEKLGMIPPDVFVSLAEKNDIIPELDWLVLEETIQFIAGDKALLESDLAASVNMSYVTLEEAACTDRILRLAPKKHGIAPKRLTIEITERIITSDHVNLLDVLIRLRINGVSLGDRRFRHRVFNDAEPCGAALHRAEDRSKLRQ